MSVDLIKSSTFLNTNTLTIYNKILFIPNSYKAVKKT